ncbi:MAG TPA: O-antigen ligase family protein [Candidatus Cryosericum sp.]|nr:O-antigen ligase family protein [Candidatus Cryosericum sp.]
MTMEPYQLNQLRIRRLTTNVYLSLVCFGLPLVFTRFFFNITETKHVFFIVCSLVYALALILIAILLPKGYGVAKAEQAPVAPALWFLAAFFICLVLGGLLGGHPEDAFFGQNNRYQGILSVFTYCLVALALSRQTLGLRLAEAAVAAGAALVGALGLINHYGLDPFGFMTNLTAFDKGRFLSTIGNADFYGSYLSLAFPVTFGLFLHAGQKRTRVLSALALVCVSFGALVAGSDSTALGMIAAAVVFPLVLFCDPRGLRRYFAGWAVFALSALCFGLLSPVLPSATYLSAFCVIVSKAPVALALLLACLVCWLALKKAPPARLLRARKAYWITLLAAAVLCIAALILLNTALSGVPLGGAENYLRFSESWGTDRGKIWAFCLRVYDGFTPIQKLFGGGPGALYHADAQNRVFTDAVLDTAHNEYLQYLLVSGGAGLLSFLAFLLLTLIAGAKKSLADPLSRGFTVAVAAYAVQALVNISQPASTPLFFVFCGLICSKSIVSGGVQEPVIEASEKDLVIPAEP